MISSSEYYISEKGEKRPAIAVRIERIPCCLPIEKEQLAAEVRKANKNNHEVGEVNCSVNFKSGKAKAIILYMDAFDDEIKEKLLSSKQPLKPVMGY